MEANDKVEAKLLTQLKDGETELTQEQQEDLYNTSKECESKRAKVKGQLQKALWDKFGKNEMSIALLAADEECRRTTAVEPEDMNLDGYEFMLNHLEGLVKTAKEVHGRWRQWVPEDTVVEIRTSLKGLELQTTKLVSKKADFIQQRIKEEVRREPIAPSHPVPAIKLKPTALPIFTGNKREFHRWKKDWEALQRQGEPTGSKEVKKAQLLDSVEDKIRKDLRLTTHNTADDIFRVLENRYGNRTSIAIEIVEELQRIQPVKNNQPRKVVELIQDVEKALQDLSELGDTGAIKNPLVTKSIEGKLPGPLRKEWLIYAADTRNAVTPASRFDGLLDFLKEQESIYEQLEQLDEEPNKRESKPEPRHARTKSTKASDDHTGCVVCGDGKHRKKLYYCMQFRALQLAEKKAAAKKLGACKRCLEVHDDSSDCKEDFLCTNHACKDEHAPEHHFYLCPNKKSSSAQKKNKPGSMDGKSRRTYTEEQEDFVKKLSPELARQFHDAFSNAASKTFNTTKVKSGLLAESGLQELPVMMMLLEVTANAGEKIGTLIDLASDTNYITHKAADKLNLRSEDITLIVHGVGGMKTIVETKRYLLKIRVKTPRGTMKSHQLVCYGLDSIVDIHKSVDSKRLQKFFLDVPLGALTRPDEVNLLISHREGQLAHQRIRGIGDLVLWDGPLGMTVGGSHPELFEDLTVSAHMSKTHFARSMRTAALRYEELTGPACKKPPNTQVHAKFRRSNTSTTNRDFLDWWKWDSIGAACDPKCGGCRCGKCQPGGKEMTLAEERELEVVKGGLTYVTEDNHSKEPHWHARYPWVEDPMSLPNNRKTAKATFLRTEKQLAKTPEWKVAYAAQVHDMIDRQAAIKLPKDTITKWDGPVWYLSHLIAPNPHSVTTPVRIVWNSSQKCRGVSMNDLLMKGPDVLNQIRAVLLRFRSGAHAALGDIKKMYNSIWLKDQEVHLHRFLWRDAENEDLEEYAITRVNIGDKPAGCIAQLAMRETANLPLFAHLEEERRVLHNDSYVDDILTSHNNLDQLNIITANVERILKTGGFELKPWVFTGQSGRKERSEEERTMKNTIILPNQMSDDDNKALGLGYRVEEDKLHVRIRINFSKRKQKMRLGEDLLQEEIRAMTPNPLTRRELLSQVSGLYDPVGLVTPAKQKGAILVRKAFQEAKAESRPVKDTWDIALSDDLRGDAIDLFEEYHQLSKILFTRALTPKCFIIEPPSAITFSDGSEHAYGAVMYLRWITDLGPIIRLVESKAKLTPLDHKGDAAKAEMCGAVFASRLRKFFELHSRIQIRKWFHFVDSQTVLGEIRRESYGYQTLFANWIGEIQSSTAVQEWLWIPGSQNIADVITRGAGPQDLDQNSEWQNGPKFLSPPESEWPTKSAKELATTARESINKLQRKAFAAVLTRAQARKQFLEKEPEHNRNQLKTKQRRQPGGSIVQSLVDVKRFSVLTRLVKIVAMV
nr:uncharacterized protein LOC133612783 [Nerophis lumbriciformis]